MCIPEALSFSGDANKMADVLLRSFNADSRYFFSDIELLSHFETNFTLPQNQSWKIVTLHPKDISKVVSTLQVVSTLRGQRLTMAQWTSQGGKSIGKTGQDSLANGASLHTLIPAQNMNTPKSSQYLL